MKEIRSVANLLVLERLAQLHVVGVGSHCDGQLADDLEVDGAPVGGGDEGIHPPVGGLGQQVDKGLQETDAQVLEVLGGLHLGRVGEADVALRKTQTGESLRTGGADSSRQAERITAPFCGGNTEPPVSHGVIKGAVICCGTFRFAFKIYTDRLPEEQNELKRAKSGAEELHSGAEDPPPPPPAAAAAAAAQGP